jgi:diguanylate cyclase (GGDEF)-like protein
MQPALSVRLLRAPRRYTYPVAGVLLALGAPVGYFVVRSLLAGQMPSPAWIEVELRERLDAYLYLTFATAAVFIWLGRKLGLAHDRTRDESLTDTLTGLPNRRFAQEQAQGLLQRRAQALSVLLIDLDGLKRINESAGHDGGDRALCAVAATLRKVCRREDVFARYGGDEFVVLLPRMDADGALRIAERICRTMIEVATGNGLGALSVSIGVTDKQRAGTDTLLGLVQAADAALHAAKLEGKNRARLSDLAQPMQTKDTRPPPTRARNEGVGL